MWSNYGGIENKYSTQFGAISVLNFVRNNIFCTVFNCFSFLMKWDCVIIFISEAHQCIILYVKGMSNLFLNYTILWKTTYGH